MAVQFSRLVQAAIMIGLGASLTTIQTTQAHEGASGVVKQRMMAMKDMADGTKELSLMVTGKKAYDAKRVKVIAAMIKGHADEIPNLFPKGTDGHPSEATAKIWTHWDDFKGHAEKLAELADGLASTAQNGKTAAIGSFAKIGKTCSGCHEDYRTKKK